MREGVKTFEKKPIKPIFGKVNKGDQIKPIKKNNNEGDDKKQQKNMFFRNMFFLFPEITCFFR